MLLREGQPIDFSSVGVINALKETIIGAFQKFGTMLFQI